MMYGLKVLPIEYLLMRIVNIDQYAGYRNEMILFRTREAAEDEAGKQDIKDKNVYKVEFLTAPKS